jgi:acetyl esterase/lipase
MKLVGIRDARVVSRAAPRLSARLQARVRALVLLAIVLDVPIASRIVRALTPEPRIEQFEIDGVPVEVVVPARRGPHPAFLFVNGAHPERRKEPVVQRLSRGLARAGFMTVVPDLPGLGEGEITTRLPDALAAVARYAVERPDVRGGRVALVGASTGASLALIAAARPELAGRISLVAAVAPFANLDKMICLTTTRHYEEEHGFVPYEVSELSRRVVARSLVASLECEDRGRLLAELTRMEREGVDPLEELPKRPGLSAKAQAVARVLANRDPVAFGTLCEDLPPEVCELMRRLSPLHAAPSVSAAVEVVVPPADDYFPFGEAAALARALPDVRLTVTRVLDHTRPTASRETVGEFADFDRFVVRSLAVAAGR